MSLKTIMVSGDGVSSIVLFDVLLLSPSVALGVDVSAFELAYVWCVVDVAINDYLSLTFSASVLFDIAVVAAVAVAAAVVVAVVVSGYVVVVIVIGVLMWSSLLSTFATISRH
jgi:hypothetical protein